MKDIDASIQDDTKYILRKELEGNLFSNYAILQDDEVLTRFVRAKDMEAITEFRKYIKER